MEPAYILELEDYEDWANTKRCSIWVSRRGKPESRVIAGDIWFSKEANEYWACVEFCNSHIMGLILEKVNQLNEQHKNKS